MESLPKRPRFDEQHPRPIHRACFWYVRNDQEAKSMRLDTLDSGQQLVSYDEKKFHGSWEWILKPSDGGAYSINFNANPNRTEKPHMFIQIGNRERTDMLATPRSGTRCSFICPTHLGAPKANLVPRVLWVRVAGHMRRSVVARGVDAPTGRKRAATTALRDVGIAPTSTLRAPPRMQCHHCSGQITRG